MLRRVYAVMKDAARARRRRIDTTPHLPQPRKENATTRLSTRRAAAARWETAGPRGTSPYRPPSSCSATAPCARRGSGAASRGRARSRRATAGAAPTRRPRARSGSARTRDGLPHLPPSQPAWPRRTARAPRPLDEQRRRVRRRQVTGHDLRRMVRESAAKSARSTVQSRAPGRRHRASSPGPGTAASRGRSPVEATRRTRAASGPDLVRASRAEDQPRRGEAVPQPREAVHVLSPLKRVRKTDHSGEHASSWWSSATFRRSWSARAGRAAARAGLAGWMCPSGW